MFARRLRWSGVSTLALGGALLAGCGSSSSNLGPFMAVGVAGPLDDHCAGVAPVTVNQASCHVTDTGGAGGAEEPAPVLYNSEGDDDDCKYHVAFTATPLQVNEAVAFDVTATVLAPPDAGNPVTGANVQIESYLADNLLHVIPNSDPKTTEGPAGHYQITPLKFDASGRWVVRFHLFQTCDDVTADSPHGHAAFYVDVP